MTPMREALHVSRSRFVLHRFGIRLALLLMITGGQALFGYATALFDLLWLFTGACVALAVARKEHPLAPDLNHWDEACGFGLLACLG